MKMTRLEFAREWIKAAKEVFKDRPEEYLKLLMAKIGSLRGNKKL